MKCYFPALSLILSADIMASNAFLLQEWTVFFQTCLILYRYFFLQVLFSVHPCHPHVLVSLHLLTSKPRIGDDSSLQPLLSPPEEVIILTHSSCPLIVLFLFMIKCLLSLLICVNNPNIFQQKKQKDSQLCPDNEESLEKKNRGLEQSLFIEHGP